MGRIRATILINEEISTGIFRLVIGGVSEIARAALPGMFINLYLNNEALLLPRPLSISGICPCGAELCLIFVYAAVGAGTRELSSYAKGDALYVLGPLGHGFETEGSVGGVESCMDDEGAGVAESCMDSGSAGIAEYGRRGETAHDLILIGGGLGIPPLLFAASHIRGGEKRTTRIRAFLGYRDEAYYSREMSRYCDEVFDISDKDGTVMDLLGRVLSGGDSDMARARVLSCGPVPMLKAVAEWAAEHGVSAQVSLEERMGCGYGACVGCTIETVNGRKKICKDGPVFRSEDIIW
jgi:dihydroorotate dehydrogenase electron transfer subunit